MTATTNIQACALDYFNAQPWFQLNLKPEIERQIWFTNPASFGIRDHIESIISGDLGHRAVNAFQRYTLSIVETNVNSDNFIKATLSALIEWLRNLIVNE